MLNTFYALYLILLIRVIVLKLTSGKTEKHGKYFLKSSDGYKFPQKPLGFSPHFSVEKSVF
jgi:hypothetical protein